MIPAKTACGVEFDGSLGRHDEVEVAQLGIEATADRTPIQVGADQLGVEGGPEIRDERLEDPVEWWQCLGMPHGADTCLLFTAHRVYACLCGHGERSAGGRPSNALRALAGDDLDLRRE